MGGGRDGEIRYVLLEKSPDEIQWSRGQGMEIGLPVDDTSGHIRLEMPGNVSFVSVTVL